MVILKTSHGDVTIELLDEAAPITVENFLAYVDDGFLDGMFRQRIPETPVVAALKASADPTPPTAPFRGCLLRSGRGGTAARNPSVQTAAADPGSRCCRRNPDHRGTTSRARRRHRPKRASDRA